MAPINYTPLPQPPLTNNASDSTNVEKREDGASYKTEPIILEEIVEHEPTEELSNHIDRRQDTIAESSVLNSAGAVSTGTSSFTTTKPITLPLTDEAIMKGSKASLNSSIRWLAERCIFYLKKAHYHLKIIHGRIVRVGTKT